MIIFGKNVLWNEVLKVILIKIVLLMDINYPIFLQFLLIICLKKRAIIKTNHNLSFICLTCLNDIDCQCSPQFGWTSLLSSLFLEIWTGPLETAANLSSSDPVPSQLTCANNEAIKRKEKHTDDPIYFHVVSFFLKRKRIDSRFVPAFWFSPHTLHFPFSRWFDIFFFVRFSFSFTIFSITFYKFHFGVNISFSSPFFFYRIGSLFVIFSHMKL